MNFGYIQDDFRVSPKLTLNIGAHYEFAGFGRLEVFQMHTGQALQSALQSLTGSASLRLA